MLTVHLGSGIIPIIPISKVNWHNLFGDVATLFGASAESYSSAYG